MTSSSFYDDVNRTCVVTHEEFGRNPQESDNNVHGESKFADVVVTPGRNAQLVTRCPNYDASKSGSRGDMCPCEGMLMSRMMMMGASSGSCPVRSSSWSSQSSHLLDEGVTDDDNDDVESKSEVDDTPPETVMHKTETPTDNKDDDVVVSSAADVTPLESGVILTTLETSSSDSEVTPSPPQTTEADDAPADIVANKAITSNRGNNDVVASTVATSTVLTLTETKTIVTPDVTIVASSSVTAHFTEKAVTETLVEGVGTGKAEKLFIPPPETNEAAAMKKEIIAPPSVCSSEASYLSETPDYDVELPVASESTTTRIGNALKKLFVNQRHASNVDLIVDGLLGVVIVFQARSFAARLYDLLSSS